MIFKILLLLGVTLPLKFEEHVDMIEYNVKITTKGDELHRQLIFYERIPSTGEYRVRDWVLLDDDAESYKVPLKNMGGLYECHIQQRNGKKYLTKILSPLLKISVTTHDPEVVDKKVLPEQFRLSLIDWMKDKIHGK